MELKVYKSFNPNQLARSPPIAYPWTIRCGQEGKVIENTYVKNVLLVNSWKGIDAATHQISSSLV